MIGRFLAKLQVKAEEGLTIAASVMIAVMMVLTTVDVVMRRVFHNPVRGSYEFVSLLFVAVVFFGLAYAQSRRAHISLGVLRDRLPAGARRPVEALLLVLSLAILALITWRSAATTLLAWQMKDTIMGAMPVATWPSRAAIPLGTGLICLRLLVQIGELLTKPARKSGEGA